MTTTKSSQNYINHIALLLDASSSMEGHKKRLIEVADEQIAYLAQRSKELDQETRITVYTFADTAECVIYDKDVLRLPSIATLYRPEGMTALIDATNLALDDLAMVPEKYGDHSFVVFVLTDGYENASKGPAQVSRNSMIMPMLRSAELRDTLRTRLKGLPDHWTVATFVPHLNGVQHAKEYGFPADNIAVWDTTSQHGVEEAVSVMRTATDTLMTNRAKGIRGSRSLFVGATVDAAQVKKKLTPLPASKYSLVPVTSRTGDESFEKRKKPTVKYPDGEIIGRFIRIDDFINRVDPPFKIGKGYYQLFSGEARKSEKIQGNKDIAILDKKTSQLYVGPAARQIVGLSNRDETVKPGANPDYEIFVKSTSENRHLPVGTKLLLLTT